MPHCAITYEGQDKMELQTDFEGAIDDYLSVVYSHECLYKII